MADHNLIGARRFNCFLFGNDNNARSGRHLHGHDYRGLRFEFGHNHTDWHFDHPSRWDDGNLLSRLIERLCHLLFLFVDSRVAYHKGELLGRFDLRCLNRHIGANSWRVQFILRDFYYCRN